MRPTRQAATLVLVPLLPLLAAAAPFPLAQVPLLGWSSAAEFLGLDDGFSKPIGHVAFLPGFHACGTLQILSVEGLEFADFDLMPSGEGSVMARHEEGKTMVKEDDAVEGTVAAWAKGWKATCGKGEANKEVRVAKVLVDGVADGAERTEWAKALGESRSLLSPVENTTDLGCLFQTHTCFPTSTRSLPRPIIPSSSSPPSRPRRSSPSST